MANKANGSKSAGRRALAEPAKNGKAGVPDEKARAEQQLVVERVAIQNFKSIDKLDLGLGRVNVLIGENGCGKTNLLEAICFGAAATAPKLDREFLLARGMRVPPPELMRSAFDGAAIKEPILVDFFWKTEGFSARLLNSNEPYSQWEFVPHQPVLSPEVQNTLSELARNQLAPGDPQFNVAQARFLRELFDGLFQHNSWTSGLANFMIYSPAVPTLRALAVESNVEPLGAYGEGLFRLLKSLEQEGRLIELKETLRLLDWFESIDVSSGSTPADRSVHLRDQYINTAFPDLDEQSSNDGFLFLLFFACLFMSSHTPAFFAVDNIDNSLNPKLAAKLTHTLVDLAKRHNKQAILTTHNPAVLDGLDLADDEQRLLVVYRNTEGRTRVRRIQKEQLPKSAQSLRLSEAFMRGYIGGLPSTF